MSSEIKRLCIETPAGDRTYIESTKKDPVIDPEDLKILLRHLPEVENLIEMTARHIAYLHQDEYLPLYAQFFTTVIENNREIFNPLSNQRKAEVLFQCYTELAHEAFLQTPAYKEGLKTVFKAIESVRVASSLKEKLINDLCKERIEWSTTFIRFAIGKSLKENPVQLKISDSPVYDQLMLLVAKVRMLFNSLNSQLYSSHMREEGLVPE